MSEAPAPARRPSPRLIAILFALLFAALAIGYFLFLRVGYVPVFTQMRPGDAAAVVAQLDAKEIAYRLADGGTSVLVREDQADGARVAVAEEYRVGGYVFPGALFGDSLIGYYGAPRTVTATVGLKF